MKPHNEIDYIVYCPDYCPSGYQIAEFNNGKWISNDQSEDISKYVVSFHPVPPESLEMEYWNQI